MDITIQVLKPSGDLLLSTIVGERYIKYRFSGWSKREAKSWFRTYVKEQTATHTNPNPFTSK